MPLLYEDDFGYASIRRSLGILGSDRIILHRGNVSFEESRIFQSLWSGTHQARVRVSRPEPGDWQNIEFTLDSWTDARPWQDERTRDAILNISLRILSEVHT